MPPGEGLGELKGLGIGVGGDDPWTIPVPSRTRTNRTRPEERLLYSQPWIRTSAPMCRPSSSTYTAAMAWGTTPPRGAFLLVDSGLDVGDGLTYGLDFLRCLVGDLDPKLVLELHDQLHRVQGVGPEVVDKRRLIRDLFQVHEELLSDDLPNAIRDFAHRSHTSSAGPPFPGLVRGPVISGVGAPCNT